MILSWFEGWLVVHPVRKEGFMLVLLGIVLVVQPMHSQHGLTPMAITWSISGRFSWFLCRWILHFKSYKIMLSFVFGEAWVLSCACFPWGVKIWLINVTWYIHRYLEIIADIVMQGALRKLDMIINYLGWFCHGLRGGWLSIRSGRRGSCWYCWG